MSLSEQGSIHLLLLLWNLPQYGHRCSAGVWFTSKDRKTDFSHVGRKEKHVDSQHVISTFFLSLPLFPPRNSRVFHSIHNNPLDELLTIDVHMCLCTFIQKSQIRKTKYFSQVRHLAVFCWCPAHPVHLTAIFACVQLLTMYRLNKSTAVHYSALNHLRHLEQSFHDQHTHKKNPQMSSQRGHKKCRCVGCDANWKRLWGITGSDC